VKSLEFGGLKAIAEDLKTSEITIPLRRTPIETIYYLYCATIHQPFFNNPVSACTETVSVSPFFVALIHESLQK